MNSGSTLSSPAKGRGTLQENITSRGAHIRHRRRRRRLFVFRWMEFISSLCLSPDDETARRRTTVLLFEIKTWITHSYFTGSRCRASSHLQQSNTSRSEFDGTEEEYLLTRRVNGCGTLLRDLLREDVPSVFSPHYHMRSHNNIKTGRPGTTRGRRRRRLTRYRVMTVRERGGVLCWWVLKDILRKTAVQCQCH